jgi:hypothetical protein
VVPQANQRQEFATDGELLSEPDAPLRRVHHFPPETRRTLWSHFRAAPLRYVFKLPFFQHKIAKKIVSPPNEILSYLNFLHKFQCPISAAIITNFAVLAGTTLSSFWVRPLSLRITLCCASMTGTILLMTSLAHEVKASSREKPDIGISINFS